MDRVGSPWLRGLFSSDPGRLDSFLTELVFALGSVQMMRSVVGRVISVLFLASQGR